MLREKFKILTNSNIFLLSLAIVYHVLVIFGVLPSDFVWSGRLDSRSEILLFESLAIVADLLIIVIVAMKAGYINSIFSRKTMNVLFWILTAGFAANTMLHIFSSNRLEAVAFTPLTLILAVLCLLLATGKAPSDKLCFLPCIIISLNDKISGNYPIFRIQQWKNKQKTFPNS